MQLKKIFVSLLVVIMILSTVVIGAMATDTAANDVFEISVAVSATETKDGSMFAVPGDTFEVNVTIENNPGAAFVQFTVKYDAEFVKPVVDAKGVVVYESEDNQNVYFYDVVNARNAGEIVFISHLDPDALPCDEIGALATLQFEVVKSAEGDTEISVVNAKAYPSRFAGNKAFAVEADSAVVNVHNYDVKNPTVQYPCTGYRLYTCECGATVEVEPNPDGHKLETVTGTPATCTTDGVSDKVYCVNEGCTYVQADAEVIPAFGHTEVPVAAVAPTCSSKGNTEGTKCTVCNEYVEAPEELAFLPHAYGEWTVVIAADCRREGMQTRYCANCVASDSLLIPMAEHKFDIAVEAVPATCLTDGYSAGFRCSVCSELNATKVKGDHNYVVIPAVEPTYAEAGQTEGKQCTVCGNYEIQPSVVPAKSLAWLWIVITAVVVMGSCVAVYFFVLRKKK